ncbi:MAG: phosphomannomutase/phosphoglucomutase [Alphaproteobacteria bacterium]|nr:phosphomannomutase/phosphoglucomutase [Alphaproteobacteria bacterium]
MYEVDATILRAYDVRGIYGKNLTAETGYLLGKAFAVDLLAQGGACVCVGHDVRLSSPELENAVVAGLSESGLRVLRIGTGPSPMLYFAQKHLGADAGIMITGSHNPAEYNGIKFCLKSGPFFGEDIQRLGEIARAGAFVEKPGVIENVSVIEEYVARLMQDYTGHYSQSRALKIVWDPANGAACNVLEYLLPLLPGEHMVLNGMGDGNFPAHHPDPCVESNMVQLARAVQDTGADLGIGFDGDADRIGVVDGEGRLIMGDQLLAFYAQELAKTHAGKPVLIDVKSGQSVLDRLQDLGLRGELTRTGHSYIKKRMQELNCPLAGEMSGHMFFADRYYGFDDGIYAAIRLIGALGLESYSLSEWLGAFPPTYITPESWHDCADTVKFGVIETIRKKLIEQQADFIDVDGVRVSTPDGWWLIRASNTQAVIVSRAEGKTTEGLKRLLKDVNDHLNQAGVF